MLYVFIVTILCCSLRLFLALANHPDIRVPRAATSWAFLACSLCAFDGMNNTRNIVCL
ncbi:unnamed protein product [Photorhabdus laumondii subsp. laumondii TTO1]|uniref:Photorhabdus luminescens subsp. laumondii TTO1 complete genome segment 10/17 n=1 Tax=Photorhabdus laumondii subsp. laumondii (strain DSM 15139 / CIP 105565 / TT01) TaxID=243265 RepID=Q7N2Z8_PHOLL|nr:unnamed protein product [Photorhabdus laumondii subsp. laumondii TTO1]